MKKRILVALSTVLVAVMLVATVSATSFGDVKEGDWFYASVQYVSDNGLMNGTGDGNFAPTRILTRAEMAVMLYNLDKALYGESEAADAAPFTDVTADWAKPAINWCYANGIITGSTATTFNPDGQLNRASMAVMFTRYIDSKGYTDVIDISRVDDTVGSYTMFNDEFDWVNYDWYWDAVHYVGEVGLMGGKDSGNPDLPNFDPEGTASRAEAATVLTRLHKFLAIPTLGAERAWALFNADYLCTVHGDVQFQYNKLGNMNGNTQATRTPEILSYDFFMKEIDRVLDYNRDEYYLVLKNRDEFFNGIQAGSAGASANANLALVRWDGSAEVENTVEVFMEQKQWVNDNVVFPNSGIVIGNWACNDTEENYAEAIQAELDRIFPEYMAAIKSSDGKIHLNYDATQEYGWTQWIQNPLMVAFYNTGLGNGFYHVGFLGQIDDSRYMYDEDEGAGEFWTQELQDGYDAFLAKLNADETFEYTDTIVLTTNTGKVNDENQWYTGMPAVTEDVTLVFHPVFDRTALMNGGEANVIIETELKADEIKANALCEDCGKLHYICSDATITEASLLADFIDMNPVLFNKNKYVVTGLKLDDQFKADLANLFNLEIASGKATFTFKDAYSMSKTLDVEIELTVQKNTSIKKAPDGRAQSTYVATLNVCPDEEGVFAAIELEKFIAENTCAECGVIHFNVNKESNAKVSKLQSAILSAMVQRNTERSVFVTSDNKTLVGNNLTDANILAALQANGRLTKDVTIVYGVSAKNDVAMATVTLDIRLDATYGAAIVPTQTLVNEISGEEFVTCPYNLENITAFEESVIVAKVNKIVEEKGTDGVIYAWYGLGLKNNDAWNNGNGTPEVRVYFDWAPREAYYLVTRFADFTDCGRAVVNDDGDLFYSEFTEETWSKVKKSGDELKAAADKSLICENAELSLHFQTKTTGKDVYVPVKLTVGRDNRVGFGGDPKGDAWAFCKSIDETMAAEKTAIQAAIDSVAADLGKDGVVAVCVNKNKVFGNGWRPGQSVRIYFDYVNSYFEGLTSAWVNDGIYIYGCLPEDEWKALGLDTPSEMPDGVIRDGSQTKTTFEIRGATSGVVQEYEIGLTLVQGQHDSDMHLIEVGSEHIGAIAK